MSNSGCAITRLDLGDARIGDECCVLLAEALAHARSSSLSALHLKQNDLTSSSVPSLTVLLRHSAALRTLSLAGAKLRAEDGAKLLSASLPHSRLLHLDLSACGLGECDGAVEDVLRGVDRSRVESLQLAYNSLAAEGGAAVASALVQPTFGVVHLAHSVESIFNALRTNNTLTELTARMTAFPVSVYSAVAAALLCNRALLSVDLSQNALVANGRDAPLCAAVLRNRRLPPLRRRLAAGAALRRPPPPPRRQSGSRRRLRFAADCVARSTHRACCVAHSHPPAAAAVVQKRAAVVRWNWARVAVVTAWMRANRHHALRFSVLALVSGVVGLLAHDEPTDFHPFRSQQTDAPSACRCRYH